MGATQERMAPIIVGLPLDETGTAIDEAGVAREDSVAPDKSEVLPMLPASRD